MRTPHGHLTYCSNIHPGETWDVHFKELQDNLPYIRHELADGQPFALGLRLANEASIELSNPQRLQQFKSWLAEHNLYVFTMNGFPYGSFHNSVVKDQVHAPDWTTTERTEYTKRLFSILAQLLPEGMDGGLSTSPLSYRFWWKDVAATDSAFQTATQNIMQIAEYLIKIKRETGQLMHLDIEPEPDGLLENSTEFVDWYRDHLLPTGVPYLQEKYGFTEAKARAAILDHIRLCFDVCHVAVAFEEPLEVLTRLDTVGIKVGKIQISSAVKVDLRQNSGAKLQALRSFNEPVYLHQVITQDSEGIVDKFPDLPEALADESATNADEWRVHFHVPLFIDSYGELDSTQDEIIKTLDIHKQQPFTNHLEIETYTWGVLPEAIQKPINQSIVRELQWVVEKLGATLSSTIRLIQLIFLLGLGLASSTLAQSVGKLRLKIVAGETGQPTPVRVRITQAGQPVSVLPAEAVAISYGVWDHADGYGFQPDSSFYVDGTCNLDLPAGTYQVALSKGPEFLNQTHTFTIESGKTFMKTYEMKRWINMAARNWYSADDHIHIRRSPRENEFLLNWIQAEDLNVGVLLKMGDFWETYYPQYAFGEKGNYQRGNFLLHSGQEDPRTPQLGHALSFGATDAVRYAEEYYYFDKVFDEIHRRGGLTGYAHQAETFHGYRGLTLDGLRGKVDMLEILQYCASSWPLRTEHYYRMLDLGFPLTAVAGSDFPWCGHDHDGSPERTARIGNARFYTYLDEPFTQAAWQKGVAAGRTFVSTGPILDLQVNDSRPGNRLDLKKGEKLTVTLHAYGHAEQVPLSALELVVHGQVLRRAAPSEPGQSPAHLSLTFTLDSVQQGMWIAARTYGGSTQVAHTTPVYVTVDGGGFHNPETTKEYLLQSEAYLLELEQELDVHRAEPEFRAWYYKKGLKTRIEETRNVIVDLRKRLGE